MIGRYVIMPDHVHFFCANIPPTADSDNYDLSEFIQQWKQWSSKRILRKHHNDLVNSHIWQKEFFDHLLRSEESYSQKWEYVRQNPVRKNLVKNAEDWPLQGEIFDLSV
jgi:REP element-mobilizing transposase RayT